MSRPAWQLNGVEAAWLLKHPPDRIPFLPWAKVVGSALVLVGSLAGGILLLLLIGG